MFRFLLIAALIFIVVRFTQRYLAANKQQQQSRSRVRPAPPEPPLPRPSPMVDYSQARDADFREVQQEGEKNPK